MSACEGAVVYGGFEQIHQFLYLNEKNWNHYIAIFDFWFHATFYGPSIRDVGIFLAIFDTPSPILKFQP